MILYIFFGGITTAVNYIMYYLSKYVILMPFTLTEDTAIAIATTIAWIVAVSVAFVTNKLFVFESRNLTAKTVLKEIIPFFVARLLSYFMNVVIMLFGVNYLQINEFIVLTFSNVLVLVFNYVASKLFIFKK
jgi:putative flippase GtrA